MSCVAIDILLADAAQLSLTVAISELADATDPVEQRTANQREAGQSHNFCLHFARQISATKLRLFC